MKCVYLAEKRLLINIISAISGEDPVSVMPALGLKRLLLIHSIAGGLDVGRQAIPTA